MARGNDPEAPWDLSSGHHGDSKPAQTSEAASAYAAAKAQIEEVRKAGVTELDLASERFAALDRLPDSIGTLVKLQTLTLIGTQVSNLAPMAGLTGLQSLDLSDTKVTDLAALAGLTELQGLTLRRTEVADLAPLQALSGLQRLDLSFTQATDLAPLAGLTRLQRLDLSSTALSNFAPLQALTGLQRLILINTQFTDLVPLQTLTGLQSLNLSRTRVTDLTPLASLTGLQNLNLGFTQVADLAPLAGLTGLQTLSLISTKVTDLMPLQGLTGLQSLNLTNTRVSDLAPLQALTGLERLFLQETKITDFSPLFGLKKLYSLDLRNTSIHDLRPLLAIEGIFDTASDNFLAYPGIAGLWFNGCLAARNDTELAKLADIQDTRERADKTRAYLQTLPPWPEPLHDRAEPDARPPDTESAEPDDTPRTPGNKPAPLMVRLTAEGTVEAETAPHDLADEQEKRAEQAWLALQVYLTDLQPLKAKIDNAMPNLGRALDSLRRAMGPDFAGMNQIDLGLQADRVTRLAADAENYLMDQDPAELQAFVAALALYLRRFMQWEAYKDDPPPPPQVVAHLRQDRAALTGLHDSLRAEGKLSDRVDASLADLTEAGTADGSTPLDARGLLDSESNLLDVVAERSLQEKAAMEKAAPGLAEKLNSDAEATLRKKALDSVPVAGGVWALTFLYMNRDALHRLAVRYQGSFGFMTAVLRHLFP